MVRVMVRVRVRGHAMGCHARAMYVSAMAREAVIRVERRLVGAHCHVWKLGAPRVMAVGVACPSMIMAGVVVRSRARTRAAVVRISCRHKDSNARHSAVSGGKYPGSRTRTLGIQRGIQRGAVSGGRSAGLWRSGGACVSHGLARELVRGGCHRLPSQTASRPYICQQQCSGDRPVVGLSPQGVDRRWFNHAWGIASGVRGCVAIRPAHAATRPTLAAP
jgi:hypothetical protein